MAYHQLEWDVIHRNGPDLAYPYTELIQWNSSSYNLDNTLPAWYRVHWGASWQDLFSPGNMKKAPKIISPPKNHSANLISSWAKKLLEVGSWIVWYRLLPQIISDKAIRVRVVLCFQLCVNSKGRTNLFHVVLEWTRSSIAVFRLLGKITFS